MKKNKILILSLCATMAVGFAAIGSSCGLADKLSQWKCEHENFDAGVVLVEPTCSEEGEILYTCFDCGKEQKEAMSAIEHNFDDGKVVKESTCTAEGQMLYTCVDCNFEEMRVIEIKEHTRVLVPMISATCVTDGRTEGYKCEVCNAWLVKPATIPALGHVEYVDKAVAATCTAEGMTEGSHCLVCNEVLLKQTVVPAIGHNPVVLQGINATCIQEGKTEGVQCDQCQMVLTSQHTIPLQPHQDKNADNLCDFCAMSHHEGLTEVAVEDGELVAGNWYRIYRPSSNYVTFELLNAPIDWDYSTNIKLMANPTGDNRDGYLYGPGPMGYKFDGMECIITELWIDVYLEEGVYTCDGATGEITSASTISINDSNKAYIYRLVDNWVTE